MDFDFKEKYDISDLVEIVRLLRSENGCPWDKVQTHESIRTDMIEECYEVCEGIDSNSPEILREELGDMLLQIVFHSQIETESGSFTFDDVCDEICKKLIYRHPHVFGEVKVSGSDEVLKNWDALKKKSKNQETFTDTLESVPKTFPALLRGEKLSRRALRAGFPMDVRDEWINKLREGLDALEKNGTADTAQNQHIIGDMLLYFCNLSRILDIDSEKALTYSSNRFIMLFRAAEEEVRNGGRTLSDLSGDELRAVMEKVFSAL